VTAVTISAHRLWINVWTDAGRRRKTPANRGVITGHLVGVRGVSTAAAPSAHRTATAGVDAPGGADLQRRQISPESTDPMTTTFLSITKD
jgi:hypothetical protein